MSLNLYSLLLTPVKLILFLSLTLGCAQEKNTSYHHFLDNYTIESSFEDSLDLKTENVFSVTRLKKPERGDATDRIIEQLPYTTASYTEYLPNGRKHLKKYTYDTGTRVEKFYYRNNLLVVKQFTENNNVYYTWLFYDDKNNIKEEIQYLIQDSGLFKYEGYSTYQYKTEADKTTVEITDYGSDSIANPKKEYIFEFPYLTKKTPLYQSKIHRYQWINGLYKPVETKDFVIEGRDVIFKYDRKGFLQSEIWLKDHHSLENKTEFYYSDDYSERTQQEYHLLGTEKSTKTLRRYNRHQHLIFEQSVEYTGNPLNRIFYDYTYDQHGNWISKKEYVQTYDSGKYSEKKLTDYEYRNIRYNTGKPVEPPSVLPEFHKNAVLIREIIPQVSGRKHSEANAFQTAVETGNYDSEILTEKARTLDEFTPKFWTLKDQAVGNLDDSPEDEAVCVYETPVEDDWGFVQHLAVFKKEGSEWKLWYQTDKAILSSAHGGMMGNPFAGISIRNRTIIISHFGGSRQKWSYTHRYRHQNSQWFLIGATINFGAPCDYFQSLDYNLSTGDAAFEYHSENCNDKKSIQTQSWKEKIKIKRPLPLMDQFDVGANEITLKKRETSMYY